MEMIYDQQFFIFLYPKQTGRGPFPAEWCKLTLSEHSEATSTHTELRDCASSRDGPRHTGKFTASIPFPRQTRGKKRSRKLKN